MESDGYNLDYLNIPYNITESSKKITDIFQRLNVLNIEDSLFELKTMLDYFDSIYNEFDKEKISKKIYSDYIRTVLIKITKLTKINNTLLKKLKDIKYSYDLDLQYNIILSPIVENIDTFNSRTKYIPFYKNVLKEGVLLNG